MANALYDKGREAFLTKKIDWVNDDIRAVLVQTSGGTPYTVNLSSHQYFSSVPSGSRLAVMGASMASKTATDGVADANDVTFSAVPSGTVGAIVIYKYANWNGSSLDSPLAESAAPLIAYLDTGTGFGITANGGDITASWDNTAGQKIFKL